MTDERLSYRFGPLERRTLLGPLRTGQAGVVGAAMTLAVLVLDHMPDAGGALLAMLMLGLGVVAVTLPVAGHTVEQWAPVAAAFLIKRATGRVHHRASMPTRGFRVSLGRGPADRADFSAQLPPTLRDTGLVGVSYRDREIGVITQRSGRRLTTVLACRARSFSLLDPEAQERRLAQWGMLLSSLESTPVRRLQWIQRRAPARGDELAQWLHSARDPVIPLRGEPIVESYLELIGSSTRVARDHEVLLAIQLDAPKTRGRSLDTLQTAVVQQAERIARTLTDAGVQVLGVLTIGQLARALRTAFDPYAGAELSALEAVDGARDGLAKHNSGPLGCNEAWDHYRCDGACHATFWIGAWPRIDVSPMFMDAILGDGGTVRSVAVTFEPVAPERSIREVEAAITRDRADVDLRRRFGQSETVRHRQAQEAARRREAELSTGHTEVRLAGFVTVTGRDQAELAQACEETHQQAARAHLELHRLYGQQAEAFTFTLPLAGGLK